VKDAEEEDIVGDNKDMEGGKEGEHEELDEGEDWEGEEEEGEDCVGEVAS